MINKFYCFVFCYNYVTVLCIYLCITESSQGYVLVFGIILYSGWPKVSNQYGISTIILNNSEKNDNFYTKQTNVILNSQYFGKSFLYYCMQSTWNGCMQTLNVLG